MIIYISLPMHGHTEADTRDRALRAKSYILAVLDNGFHLQWIERRGTDCNPIEVISPFDVAERLDQERKAEAKIRIRGVHPLPAPPPPLFDVDYLLADLRAIAKSDLVVCLDGWESSRGCLAEVAFAKARGIAVVELSESFGFCQPQIGSMDRLDDAVASRSSRDAAEIFTGCFYRWRELKSKHNPMSVRLNQDGPIDDLPF